MGQHRFDRAETSLLWIGRHVFRYFVPLAGLVALAAYDPVPALDGPVLHVGGPIVLAGVVLWRAFGAAVRDNIMWLARINLVVVVVLGGFTGMLLMSSWHFERLCKDRPEGRTCSEVAPLIIRFFNGRGPRWEPDNSFNP
jgi:hypothetical protein